LQELWQLYNEVYKRKKVWPSKTTFTNALSARSL
jgi:hypothetical protein